MRHISLIFRTRASERIKPRGWRLQIGAVGPIVVQGLRWKSQAEACKRIYDTAIKGGSSHEEAKAGVALYLNLVKSPRYDT